jgi:general L-amino acid transport system permease protein
MSALLHPAGAAAPAPRPRLRWSEPRTRALVVQAIVVLVVGALILGVALQTATNLRLRGIASGFGYLSRSSGYQIAESVIAYSSRDSYARALTVGLVNTVRVAALAIVISTALGVFVAVARLSKLWVCSALGRAYVEVVRNTPLLLQLLFWYSLSQALPGTHEAWNPLPGVFLCERGLYLPRVVMSVGHLALEQPTLARFDFVGGTAISPEFGALLIGLSIYSAAFIGEIVRGAVLSVDRGQTEAAAALGLSRARVLRLVVVPQSLPMIVPPLTSQFVGLVKNSSLGVAIGYPDLLSITNTTLSQNGQAIEAISIAMGVYLGVSLAVSLAMNLYNHRPMRRGQR